MRPHGTGNVGSRSFPKYGPYLLGPDVPPGDSFGTVDSTVEPRVRARERAGRLASGKVTVTEDDELAARLLAAHRQLAALTADPEARRRLQLRLIAICTALKLPGASKARSSRRLDRLIADAKRAQDGIPS